VFIRRRFFALVSTPLLALGTAALGASGASLRKVAVLSVIGPAAWQETIDAAETSVVAALRAKGLAVVPLADSKIFTHASWHAAYSNVRPERNELLARSGNAGQRASRNTLVLEDRLQHAGQPGYSATFCRTAGELSRQMGADGAVLLTITPSRTIQIVVIDQGGAYALREQVPWESKDTVSVAIDKALGHYPG
jgi:hypothetical protein